VNKGEAIVVFTFDTNSPTVEKVVLDLLLYL